MEQENPWGGTTPPPQVSLGGAPSAPAAADPEGTTLRPSGQTFSTPHVHRLLPRDRWLIERYRETEGIAAANEALYVDYGLVTLAQAAEAAAASAAPPVDRRRRGSPHLASDERGDRRTHRSD